MDGEASASDADDKKVVYEQDGIFIFVNEANGDRISAGKLFVTQMPYGIQIQWKQTEETEYCLEQVHEWSMVNTTVGYKAEKNGADALEFRTYKGRKREITFELSELKRFKYVHPEQGWPQITFYLRDGTSHSPMYFQMGNVEQFVDTMKNYVKIKHSKEDSNLWIVIDAEMEALERSINNLSIASDRKKHIVSKFLQDPYTTTLSHFSKLTKVLFDYVGVDGVQPTRANEEVTDILQEALFGLDINQHKEPGFEVVTKNNLIPRPTVHRGQPLGQEEWLQHLDSEGRVVAHDKLLQTIFRGGVESSIRHEIWKFLLGCYKFDSTYKERQELRRKNIDDYYRMKLQWKTITPEQEERFSDFRERKHSIVKDVNRTDRTHPFYRGENNENIQILHDILMTHCMYNFDLGYVQGMNDLLSPILLLINNEVDAFFCFSGFMDRVWPNFVVDMNGITTQLKQLHTLLKFVDPELCDLFENYKCQHLLFCFRWLLLFFKREFTFPDIMRVWEVLWTNLPCKNFHLLFALAILDSEKSVLMESTSGDDVLKHINKITERIDPEENLKKAEGIYLQLYNCAFLPHYIQDIVGIQNPSTEGEPSLSTLQAIENTDAVNKSPQSNTSSIELLPECDNELRFQRSLELQYL